MRPTTSGFLLPRHADVALLGGAAALLFSLTACQTPVPAPDATPAPPAASSPAPLVAASAPPAAPERPTLVDEQRRLAALFRGTPVVFAMQSENRLQVDVPLRNSFDAGKSAIKAPLAAVLDRIAASQSGGSSRISVSAPGDRIAAAPARAASAASAANAASAPGKGAAVNIAAARQERLASDRRRSISDYLVRKGLDAGRLVAAPATPAGTSARLLIDDRPTP